MSVFAMIPARMGSERLRMKNLALINGKPLISYALDAANGAGVFDKVVLNSDGAIFEEVAQKNQVDFYLRPEKLGSSETKSDDVVYDFMQKFPCDIVAWVNPISPLQSPEEVRSVVQYFIEQELDSLVTVEEQRVHCAYEDQPINFQVDEIFAKTQDLTPVQPFVYSVMMWRSSTFMNLFEKQGYALLSGKLGYFPVSKKSAVIIKTEEDLMIAESILKASEPYGGYQVKYDQLASA